MYRNVHVVQLPFPVLFLLHLLAKLEFWRARRATDCRVAITTAGVLPCVLDILGAIAVARHAWHWHIE